MQQSPLEKLTSSLLVKKFPTFYGNRMFITAAQEPANCLYPESARSSTHSKPHFLKIHFIIIIPSMSGFPKWSLSLWFPHKNLWTPVVSQYALHALPISFFSECYRSNNSTLASNQKVPVLLHTAHPFSVTVGHTSHICYC